MLRFYKKFIFVVTLSFLSPLSVFANIEDDYKRQQENISCNYESSNFYSLSSNERYCVSGEYWQGFSFSGYSFSEGILNRSLKSGGIFGPSTITKYKIEDDYLVLYSCKGTSNIYNFECIGPIKRNKLAISEKKFSAIVREEKIKKLTMKMQNELQNIFDEDVEKYGIAKAHERRARAKKLSLWITDYEGAIYDYTISINKTNKMIDRYYSLLLRGEVKFKLKNYSNALLDYENALRLYQISSIEDEFGLSLGYFLRGQLKLALGKYNDAIKDLNFSLSLLQKTNGYDFSGDIHAEIGVAKFYLKDYSGSIKNLTLAIDDMPNSGNTLSRPYYFRSFARGKKGDKNGKCRDLISANEIAKMYQEGLGNIEVKSDLSNLIDGVFLYGEQEQKVFVDSNNALKEEDCNGFSIRLTK